MSTATTTSNSHARLASSWLAMVPLIALPAAVWAGLHDAPPWQLMWGLTLTIYAGCKWLTFVTCPLAAHASLAKSLGYLMLWPGMNATAFFGRPTKRVIPSHYEWNAALFKLASGTGLLVCVIPALSNAPPLAIGWIGLVGLALVLHFGLFQGLSLCWQSLGINAAPIMRAPLLAPTLSDFWGRRWNSAFRDLAFGQLFRPLAKFTSVTIATVIVFVVSGLIHDLVISLPVRAGWGQPTLYFVLQVAGLLLERSRLGQAWGLGQGLRGRVFCVILVLAPLRLLFHDAFVLQAIVPTLQALRGY